MKPGAEKQTSTSPAASYTGVRRNAMLEPNQVEELICLVAALDRPALIRHLQNVRASFPVDFTSEFLDTADLDRLRHILVALCLHCQHMPDLDMPSAA
jgi:hypothetical protein